MEETMKAYKDMSKEELRALQIELQSQYEKLKEEGIKLDMSRGKPGADQLDLSLGMLDVLNSESVFKGQDNMDLRNYGLLDGIKEAKALFAEIMECDVDHVMVYGNSSLNIMYDLISRAICLPILESGATGLFIIRPLGPRTIVYILYESNTFSGAPKR